MDVVNQMKMYRDEIKDVVNRILSNVKKSYDSAVSVIENTKDLSTLTLLEKVGIMNDQYKRVNKRTETSLKGAFFTSHKNKND